MTRALRWYDYITVNVYFLGLTTLSQTLTPLLLPLLVQQFVGEARQGAFFGTLRMWSLVAALLVQALMGLLSDRSRSSWGRRRPFIFFGTLADLAVLALIGLYANLVGMTGYIVLFIVIILHQVAINAGYGAAQGLIPDLVPEGLKGRFSSVKALLELPIPLILVAFTAGPLISKGNLWGGLLVAMGVLVVSMLITMLVNEQPLQFTPPPLNWTPFIRLVLMTGVFTVIILGMGEAVKIVGNKLPHNISSNTLFLTLGIAGLISMGLAVGLGVWISIQIGLGQRLQASPSFTWWVVNRLAYLVGATNLASFAIFFLQGRLGYAKEEAAGPTSFLMMLVGVFILFFALPSGWLADRLGPKPLVAFAGITAALGSLIVILAPNLTIIYIGGCFLGAATGVFYTGNWALGTDLVPKGEAGRFLGISNLAGAGAGAIGAYIGGPIADYITINMPSIPGMGYVLVFAIYGVLFLLSTVALTKIKEY